MRWAWSGGRWAELAQGPALGGHFLPDLPQFQRQLPEFGAQPPHRPKLRPQDGGLGLGSAALLRKPRPKREKWAGLSRVGVVMVMEVWLCKAGQ